MKSRIDASHHARIQTAIVTCPDCGEKLVLNGALRVGVQVWCQNCEAELEVVNLAPVEVNGVSPELTDDQDSPVRW